MARTKRRQNLGVDEQLAREPWRFEFFQAAYILERLAEGGKLARTRLPGHLIGHDTRPEAEPVRFKALPSRSFPAGEIPEIHLPEENEEPSRAEVSVSFMGLTGPAGVLPDAYLDLLLDRLRLRDTALRDFLDIFNHRTISLFYRAWEKHQHAISFDRAKRDETQADPFGRYLASFSGIGLDGTHARLRVDDDVVRHFAGHFSHYPRNASALESMLNDLLSVPVRIEQFQGQWLYVAHDECSRLPSLQLPRGRYCLLGQDAMVGDRVFDVQGQIALVLGPLDSKTFMALLPDKEWFPKITDIVRLYVGAELGFEIRLQLAKDQVRAAVLGGTDDYEPRLGWNTWIGEYRKDRDADDTRFTVYV